MKPRNTQTTRNSQRERAALVGLFNDSPRHFDPEHQLDELAGLASAAGADSVLRVQQERAKPDPATFLGKGKVAMLAAASSEARVDTVIFDNELSPAQLRNLEGALDRKVVDRTQLILDIFARRARTKEGKLQVELAQLKYLMPRLVGSSDALSRQGGGIGTLGPGETKLETDRRRIRHRISILSKEIDTVRRRRSQLRERRHKSAVPTVALVGYTNAGKTTMFNLLTGGDAVASNALFVTLDPLVRRVKLPDRRELLVSDTVGFIDRLPHSVVAAFRATLEEVAEADLLLHVIDAAAPDRDRRIAAVNSVLAEVGATKVPSIEVFNKCDQLGEGERARVAALYPGALCVSALTGEGRDEVVAAMETRLGLDTVTVTFEFDPHDERDRDRISELYRFGRILRHVASDTSVTVEAELPKRLLERFRRSWRMLRVRPSAAGRQRRRIAAAFALLVLMGGCAKKTVNVPAPAGAPRFADFVFPAAGPDLAVPAVLSRHRDAWQMLQSGDAKAAEREFTDILKQAPDFYPADAGLGYAALARKDGQAALAHFDQALTRNGSYAPALAGRGESLLAIGRADAAADAFQAALAADASLTALRGRAEALKFRGVQQNIESARKAAEDGKLDEARAGYLAAIAASPESAFLYRELAAIEHKSGDHAPALVHARQAVTLDPSDVRALLLIAEVLDGTGEWTKAADAYAAANAVEPMAATAVKIDQMREKAAFQAMPEQYRSIESSPAVTRAQLAALLGTRLGDILRRAEAKPVVVTDARANWAAPWIQSVTRAGVMEPFPNHTFQPNTTVRRGDLAQAVSRVLALVATANPRIASRWRDPRPKFSDVGPAHLFYAAAARAVSAGVMAPLDGGTFQLTRPVTGSEARDTVSKLEALARR